MDPAPGWVPGQPHLSRCASPVADSDRCLERGRGKDLAQGLLWAPGMQSTILTGAILGVDAYKVIVEVDLGGGLPKVEIVGLPEGAVRESKVRVESAIKAARCHYPLQRICVNLAPADTRKDGSALDMPIALGILVATGALSQECVQNVMVAGELSLSGELRPVRGALPLAVLTRDLGIKELLLPPESCSQAAVVAGINVRAVPTLRAAVDHLRGHNIIPVTLPPAHSQEAPDDLVDLSDVRGQLLPKRALEIAAAGGHNMLLVGPPGSGKTMLCLLYTSDAADE